MSAKWTPEALCDNILAAPRLRRLTWDFMLYDEQVGPCTSWEDFGSAEAEWLKEVARLATQRKAALREIRIIFYLEYCVQPPGNGEKSPWDWMEDAKVELERSHIKLLIN
jgi:hypothetical protein